MPRDPLANTVTMLCAYCGDRLTWPDDFPVRTQAVCRPCGERMYGWPTQGSGSSSDPADPDTTAAVVVR